MAVTNGIQKIRGWRERKKKDDKKQIGGYAVRAMWRGESEALAKEKNSTVSPEILQRPMKGPRGRRRSIWGKNRKKNKKKEKSEGGPSMGIGDKRKRGSTL